MVNYSPNNANFLFEGIDSRDLVLALDRKGIMVSAGSACSDKSRKASRIIMALGKPEKLAKKCIRISLGKYTTKDDIKKTVEVLSSVVCQLRKI